MKLPSESEITRLYGTEEQKISLHLKIRYVYEEDQRWHLHIVPDEMTTALEWRNSWGDIDAAREKLKRWQGTDPTWFSVALLLDLEERKRKSSYGKLAMDMNFDTLVFLLWSNDQRKGDEWAKAGQINFQNLLQALGMKTKKILEHEKYGRSMLSENKIPWGLKDGPISGRRICDALVQFETEKNNNKIVIGPSTTSTYLTRVRSVALTASYWTKAKKLLEEHRRDEFDAYAVRWNTRTNELLNDTIEFSGLTSQ